MTLHELTEELMLLLSYAEDGDDDEALLGSWEAVSGEFDEKVENYCLVIAQMEADASALKAEEKRLKEKRERIENRVTWMKDRIKSSLEAVGKKEAGGNLYKAKIRKAGGRLPVILDVEEDKVPFDFQKCVVSPNMEAIRDALDKGAIDFAHYGERSEYLKIN